MIIEPELVCSAQRGDVLAMSELLDQLAPYVGRLCGPIAGQDGADAAQEALIGVFRQLGQVRDPRALLGWVRVIAVREAIRVARRTGHPPVPLPDIPERGDPQLGADIRDVLDRLSPEHRAILVLRDVEGLDEKTVSEVLSLSVGTVKSRLHRARAHFQRAWGR